MAPSGGDSGPPGGLANEVSMDGSVIGGLVTRDGMDGVGGIGGIGGRVSSRSAGAREIGSPAVAERRRDWCEVPESMDDRLVDF